MSNSSNSPVLGAPDPTPSGLEGERAVRVFGAVVRPFQAFLRLEAASGILLFSCAVAALAWANLHSGSYLGTFERPLVLGAADGATTFTLRTVINDVLMAIFFFVVGMEIKRELAVGELDSVRKATLPAIGALGGMLVPSAIFLAFNWGGAGQRGWGIPMATDIAFCIGILTLLGDRVPRSLVVFVTALAIFDDIGGILVIAIFYGHGLSIPWLLGALLCTLLLFGMNRAYVINGVAYAVLGAGLWYALHEGGIHATLSGVVLGVMIPVRPRRPARDVLRELARHVTALDDKPADEELDAAEILAIEEKLEDMEAPLHRFVHLLHPWVAFLIMPAFALANSGVSLRGLGLEALVTPVALGTAAGLFFGKLVGIFGLTLLAVRLRVSPMPAGSTTTMLFGVSVVAGVGFTVALFIAALAFHGQAPLLEQAKLGILVGSAAAGLAGFALLRFGGRAGSAGAQLPNSAPAQSAAASATSRAV